MKWECAQHGQGASGQVVCQDGREESRCSQGTVRGPDLITPFRSWAGCGVCSNQHANHWRVLLIGCKRLILSAGGK